MRVERVAGNPIVRVGMSAEVGDNVNGPSLIRVPEWVRRPLGRYYLYFAHHRGRSIRLAYGDRVEGPWTIHAPGTLRVEDSGFVDHIASPDVHVDRERREIRMYFHGLLPQGAEGSGPDDGAGGWMQGSRLATSRDGLGFRVRGEVLGAPYFRVFSWRERTYALGMPGILYRSDDGFGGFERGPTLFTANMRHSALLLRRSTLHVFYSNAGDCPERILHSAIDLSRDWLDWRASESATVIEPETDYEGVDLPLEPSKRGLAAEPVRQLRDPAIFEEDDELFLLYSVAGEQGIALARLHDL